MRYRQLGSSPITVSEIGLGSWLTMAGGLERERAQACLKAALELGITFIDTANIYGRGIAESFLGEALAGVPRGSYVLATKLFFPMTPEDRGLSRTQIVKQLDASLQRLRTSYIDLYQCHRHDPDTPLEETMRALSDAIAQGKIRCIGFSEWPLPAIRAATAMAGVEHFVSSQPQYSMLHRQVEADIMPYCESQHISQVVWSPLGQGILTGKYLPDAPPPEDSRASSQAMGVHFVRDWLHRDVLRAVQDMKPLAAQVNLSVSQFCLAWVLRKSNVASAIIGASRPAQVAENAIASGAEVPPALFLEAERLLADALARAKAGAR